MAYLSLFIRLALLFTLVYINHAQEETTSGVTDNPLIGATTESGDNEGNVTSAQGDLSTEAAVGAGDGAALTTSGAISNEATTTQGPTLAPVTTEAATTVADTTTLEPTTTTTAAVEKTPRVNILFTYETDYHEKLIQFALEHLEKFVLPKKGGFELGAIRYFSTKDKDKEPLKLVTAVCKEIDANIPDIVIDLTKAGISSESVKVVTRALQLPTVSAAIGQPGDVREWRKLLPWEEKYLIQVSPTSDVAIQVIRTLVIEQQLKNIAIFYDKGFKMFHHQFHLLRDTETRHVMMKIPDKTKDLRAQISRIRKVDYNAIFIAAIDCKTIEFVLAGFDTWTSSYLKKLSWYTLTLDKGLPTCSKCSKTYKLVHFQPKLDAPKKSLDWESKALHGSLNDVFHMDLILKGVLATGVMKSSGKWPTNKEIVTCSTYKWNSTQPLDDLDLLGSFKTVGKDYAVGPEFILTTNGWNHVKINLQMHHAHVVPDKTVTTQVQKIGEWVTGERGDNRFSYDAGKNLDAPQVVFRIVTVVEPPFVYLKKNCKANGTFDNCYEGYAIDILNALKKRLNFNYTIYDVDKYGFMAEQLPHDWDGMMKLLKYQEVDIAIGAISVYPEREKVMEFTHPIYDLVGYQILMKKEKAQSSLFKFLTVLENDVWMCILGAYFFTSALMWIFDRWSPYSFQNNREKYEDDEEKREFTLKECLWFCMTSLTPQGGGEAPKNLSGRLVAATWWLFGFIIIASYTANLAAFLTVSRLEAPIDSLEDLSKQYKVQYSPVQNSSTWWHFDRMAHVEHQFYEAWKDMSLNDSLTDYERSVLAVWEYPVSDKYTKIWQAILENLPPKSVKRAVLRTKGKLTKMGPDGKIVPDTDEFAWIAEATEVRYHHMSNCEFRIVGQEFCMNPYAFGVQKGSPLKYILSEEIRKLEHERLFEKLKKKWWEDNKENTVDRCSTSEDLAEGISIHNIGGVFVVIVVGFSMTIIATILELWWYWRDNMAYDITEAGTEGPSRQLSAAFGPMEKADFHAQYAERPRTSASDVEY